MLQELTAQTTQTLQVENKDAATESDVIANEDQDCQTTQIETCDNFTVAEPLPATVATCCQTQPRSV